MSWSDASGILAEGGTVIGTARCPEFREYEGRHAAALHLIEKGIDRLVVIGGDGSLSGTEEFRTEWAQHLSELVDEGAISAQQAQLHQRLYIVGLVGSIDNDMVGTDMTIGADSALHRIVDAIDQISSTAASHQRTFVVEVMGRHCGYLPLMSAVAGGADYVFTPEDPARDGWEDEMDENPSSSSLKARLTVQVTPFLRKTLPMPSKSVPAKTRESPSSVTFNEAVFLPRMTAGCPHSWALPQSKRS